MFWRVIFDSFTQTPTIAFVAAALVSFLSITRPATAAEVSANPSNYRKLMSALKAGDTLELAPGRYPPLAINGLNGTANAWITIKGPALGMPVVITGESGRNTVEISNCSFVAIENLRIDSLGIPGAFGISAKGGAANLTHDIRIEGNILVGQNGGQGTDGISTKTPTWRWIIRNNQILGAGTGLYLGNSDGTQPFVEGLIENNLIKDTIGYNMEIKDQNSIPPIPGMPTETTSTIIRNNVFIKNDDPSPDGDRPNLLVGAFPGTGIGSHNLYEIYGNFFYHNHREALFQGSGRFSLHDNIFVDGPHDYPALVLRNHNFPLKLAYIYNNTIYTTERGIYFGNLALAGDAVFGNLIFGSAPITGMVARASDNLTGPLAIAQTYVNSPSFELGAMDFYPRAGKCQGKAMDLSLFQTEADFGRDFNGALKAKAKGGAVFRGAYAGTGTNPGWRLQAAIKPASESAVKASAVEDGATPAIGALLANPDTLVLISPPRSNDFAMGNTTGTTPAAASALHASLGPARRTGSSGARSDDAYPSRVLLRQSLARTEPAPAQRCDRSAVAWAGRRSVALAGGRPTNLGSSKAL